jgi:adenosylhomocysteine nucleosidase
MIAFLFPFRNEGEELVAKMTEIEDFFIGDTLCLTGKLEDRSVVIMFTGMGMEAARHAAKRLIEFFRVKAVVLAGYGGALVPQLKRGQIVLSHNHTTEEVLQFVRFIPGFSFTSFYSSDVVLKTAQHKSTVAQATECQVVDMETAAVAEVILPRQLPFIAVRVISDELTDVVPEAVSHAYSVEKQCVTPGKLAWYFLWHPRQIKHFKIFVSNLKPVRHNLTKFLLMLNKELPKGW